MDQKRRYRGFQNLANSHEIQCEHHLVAGLFVCGKSVLIVSAFLKPPKPRKWGRRGRETRLFAKRKCRALLVYKQSYGSFEMVSPPRKQLILKFISIAKILSFTRSPFTTAKSDILSHRLQTVSAALNLERFASSARERNGAVEIFSFSRLSPQTRRGRRLRRPAKTVIL